MAKRRVYKVVVAMNVCHTERDSSVFHVAYRLASLANDSSCSSSGHLDVSLQFDLLLWPKEVLLLQFAIDSALSLQDGARKVNQTAACDTNQAPIKIVSKIHGTHVSWQSLVSVYLKLSLRGSCHNHHPHFRVWSFSWGDLEEKKHSLLT